MLINCRQVYATGHDLMADRSSGAHNSRFTIRLPRYNLKTSRKIIIINSSNNKTRLDSLTDGLTDSIENVPWFSPSRQGIGIVRFPRSKRQRYSCIPNRVDTLKVNQRYPPSAKRCSGSLTPATHSVHWESGRYRPPVRWNTSNHISLGLQSKFEDLMFVRCVRSGRR